MEKKKILTITVKINNNQFQITKNFKGKYSVNLINKFKNKIKIE